MEKNFKTGRYTETDSGEKNWFIGSEDQLGVVCCYMNLPSGWTYPHHLHQERSEIIVILEGFLTVKVENASAFNLEKGEFLSIKKNTPIKLMTPKGGAKVIFIHPGGENDAVFPERPPKHS